MPTPSPTDLSSLFTGIVQQFQHVPQLNQYSVFLSINDELLDPEIADNYVSVCPGSMVVDQHLLNGGSNTELYFIGEFAATLHLRLDLDAGIRSDSWLVDPAYGVYAVIFQMQNWMSMFQVNPGTPVPVKLNRIDKPKLEKSVLHWGIIKTTWNLEYWASVPNQPYA